MKARIRFPLEALSTLLILTVFIPAALPAPAFAMPVSATSQARVEAAPFACTYIVRPGDNLFRLGLRFGVSPFAIALANGITNLNLIFVGMVLRVPCTAPPPSPSPTVCNIHIVQRGEWLTLIAARFGVSAQSVAALNRLSNPNLIFPGQRLLIPCSTAAPGRAIFITAPTSGQAVCTPVSTRGTVTVNPFESTLRGRVFNTDDAVVGEMPIHVTSPSGFAGTFAGSIPFDTTRVQNGSTGRVEVADISPRDGSVLASASVSIRFSCGL